jgi:hypothetical protein
MVGLSGSAVGGRVVGGVQRSVRPAGKGGRAKRCDVRSCTTLLLCRGDGGRGDYHLESSSIIIDHRACPPNAEDLSG